MISNYLPDMDSLPKIEPVELKNGGFLKFRYVVRVLNEPGADRGLHKMTTLSYTYQHSTTSPDDPDWVFRYEYETQPLDPKARYPAGHLHVNATPGNYARIETIKDFPSLHLPTRRLSFEEIVWHLANEHTPGISSPNKQEWFEFLNKSKAAYEARKVAERRPGLSPLLEG